MKLVMTSLRGVLTALAFLLPFGVPTAVAAPARSIGAVVVKQVSFDPTLQHNIANLLVQVGSQQLAANFLTTYDQTGGLERWGYPTSEVFQEEPGNLVQYFQRGVLDWHWRADLQRYVLERRLAWDYFGGDRAGAGNDQGVEPPVTSGKTIGPWGHTVSNTALDGTYTGFADFFQRYGGVNAFGYPKTEARVDTGSGLHIPGATNGFIRQYFQAAVLEYHPESPTDPVELRLLGDDLRDLRYPGGSWQSLPQFEPATQLAAGAALTLAASGNLVVDTSQPTMTLDPPDVLQGRSVVVHVSAPAGMTLHGLLDGQPSFELAPYGNEYWGIVGLDAWTTPGAHSIAITTENASGTSTLIQSNVNVVARQFPWMEDLAIPVSKGDITQRSVQIAENERLAPIFTTFTPHQYWQGTFLRPVPGPVTTPFGTDYSSDGGKTFHNYHEGIDIGAWTGTPILAANDGRVVVARRLHVRGNGVIIDHGMGIFSGYYHMSRIVAHVGEFVHKGDLIGYVGQTGLATGPHLHWEIRADNQYVDPAEWLTRVFGP